MAKYALAFGYECILTKKVLHDCTDWKYGLHVIKQDNKFRSTILSSNCRFIELSPYHFISLFPFSEILERFRIDINNEHKMCCLNQNVFCSSKHAQSSLNC